MNALKEINNQLKSGECNISQLMSLTKKRAAAVRKGIIKSCQDVFLGGKVFSRVSLAMLVLHQTKRMKQKVEKANIPVSYAILVPSQEHKDDSSLRYWSPEEYNEIIKKMARSQD